MASLGCASPLAIRSLASRSAHCARTRGVGRRGESARARAGGGAGRVVRRRWRPRADGATRAALRRETEAARRHGGAAARKAPRRANDGQRTADGGRRTADGGGRRAARTKWNSETIRSR
jgi:hypothetical protein